MKNYVNIKKYIFIALFILTAFPLFCRDVTIVVLDAELDIPLEGAVVRTRTGDQYICDQNGMVVLQAPEDRQFIINAAYPGYETGVLSIPVSGNFFTINLRLSGILQERELVIEATRPGTSETRTGRSIAVSQREISQTGEIGIIEDVMSTIKLLPGVSYSGAFNAQPSIRGGHPGDMGASLDGFFLRNPYFWGGGFSIFDPRMVQSAQLSHGVFSSRFGHTISGLLEITTKSPSPTETQFELGINTSAANFSLSIPLFGRGGILFMGRVTYYDPIIALAKELSGIIPELSSVHYIRQAPYIRTATVNANYRFTDNLELTTTIFWGMDGVGVFYENSSDTDAGRNSSVNFDFTNFQGFLTSALYWNPKNDMLLKFMVGVGYEDMIIDGTMDYDMTYETLGQTFTFESNNLIQQSDFQFNIQGRIDFDWEISKNFLLSAGIQEMFSFSEISGIQQMYYDTRYANLSDEDKQKISDYYSPLPVPSNLMVSVPAVFTPDSQNRLLTTSGYILGEFNFFDNQINMEVGLRIDHFVLFGNGFTLQSDPAFNPRINMDINILKNAGFIQSLDISLGTGLFSSINETIILADEKYNLDFIKPNRSWTSILGIRFEFPRSLSLNIEGYYKYIFDRTYVPVMFGLEDLDINPQFDGEGTVWGIDVMIHKIQSRFWDGWLSYSYNNARYRDPQGRYGGLGFSGGNSGNDWYFPSYHRFHYLNLVLNIKPIQSMNIYMRFGIASGIPLARRVGDSPIDYPVLIYDKDDINNSREIVKYFWPSVADDSNRTTPSFPLDIKFSIFGSNRNGRTRYEVYVAIENLLSLLYVAEGNTRFNPYTGEENTGSTSANYEIPMPIPSFGFKISY